MLHPGETRHCHRRQHGRLAGCARAGRSFQRRNPHPARNLTRAPSPEKACTGPAHPWPASAGTGGSRGGVPGNLQRSRRGRRELRRLARQGLLVQPRRLPAFGNHAGVVSLLATRPVLETEVRRRLVLHPNITMRDACSVVEPVHRGDRVTGVRLQAGGDIVELRADLVVDATGRGSRSPKWIEAMGFHRPPGSAH